MIDWFQYLAVALGLILGSLSLLTGVVLMVVGWGTLRRRLGQGRWIRVPAEILSATIETRSFDEAVHYLPKITYRFPADGGLVTASRLALAERSYPKERGARKKLEQYPVGTTVLASYPDGKPGESVLELGGGWAGLLVLLLGLLLTGAALLAAEAAGLPARGIGVGIVSLFALLWLGNRSSQNRQRRARRDGLLPPPGCGSDADVERLLGRGEKLLAIKLYRELHGTDLKTAKEKVEKLGARQEENHSQAPWSGVHRSGGEEE